MYVPLDLDAWQAERCTAAHGDRFRLALTQIARGQRVVVVLAFCGVAEEHMRQFVKARHVRQRTDRRDGDRPAAGVPCRFSQVASNGTSVTLSAARARSTSQVGVASGGTSVPCGAARRALIRNISGTSAPYAASHHRGLEIGKVRRGRCAGTPPRAMAVALAVARLDCRPCSRCRSSPRRPRQEKTSLSRSVCTRIWRPLTSSVLKLSPTLRS